MPRLDAFVPLCYDVCSLFCATVEILGPQNAPDSYADSVFGWSPSSYQGTTAGLQSGGGDWIAYSHDTWASYLSEGYAEYIEVEIGTTVHAQSITIGENRGMWSIVKIKAWDSSTSRWQTLYAGDADPDEWKLYRATNRYNHFEPSSICQTTFTTSVVRIEMDTYAIVDWNELDYVKVVGATTLKTGVLTTDAATQTAQVMYVPDADFTGVDSFAFEGCDCAYDSGRISNEETVTISVLPVNDPPVAQFSAVAAACSPGVGDEITLQASDVDAITEANTSIAFAITSLPLNAALYDAGSGALITSASLPATVSGATVSLFADYGGLTDAPSGFEFTFTSTDEIGAVSVAATVAVTCSATECPAGKYFGMDDRACAECPAGMFAADIGIRSSCEPCAVGTSAGEGSVSCASCDAQFVAMKEGLSSCEKIPSGTEWLSTSSYQLLPGIWRPEQEDANNQYVYECPILEACPDESGYGAALCAEGFVGPLCSHCDSDYFLSWCVAFVGCCSQFCSASALSNLRCCQAGEDM